MNNNELNTLAESLQEALVKLANLLQSNHMMLATAESCTGGLIAKSATDLAGCSAWFSRALVTYSNTAKQELLGVSEKTLSEFGAVSEQTVIEMAEGLLSFKEVGAGISISGIAGPGGGAPDKPVGTVWIAWKIRGQSVKSRCFQFDGDRHTIRLKGALEAIVGLVGWLENNQS